MFHLFNPKKKLVDQTITVVRNKGVSPVMVSSKNRISRNQTIAIFNNIEKRPKVKNFKGIVIKLRIGLMKKLMIPKIPPITTRMRQYSVRLMPKKLLSGKISKVTPVINLFAKNNDNMPVIMCQNRFPNMIFLLYTFS